MGSATPKRPRRSGQRIFESHVTGRVSTERFGSNISRAHQFHGYADFARTVGKYPPSCRSLDQASSAGADELRSPLVSGSRSRRCPRIPARARALACTRFLTWSLEKRLRSWALIRRAQLARELCRFGHLGVRFGGIARAANPPQSRPATHTRGAGTFGVRRFSEGGRHSS
jgi:hypothetical protein